MNTRFTKTRLACVGLAVTALGVAASDPQSAHAAEIPAAQDISNINYTAQIHDDSVVLRTDAGSLDVHDGLLRVLGADGTVVSAVALDYQLGDLLYPITAAVHGNEAVLTPRTARAAGRRSVRKVVLGMTG